MFRRLVPLALAAVLAALSAPARADDLSTVRAKVAAAMQGAKSFVVTTTASTGFTVTLTFVAPDRYHSALVYGGGTRDIVLVGPVAYVSADGGQTYRKTDTPPSVLDDKVVAGKTWGRFATTAAGPEKDQHLNCTYDKKTYRLNDCVNEGFSLVFSRYDDPANVVAIPALASPAPR